MITSMHIENFKCFKNFDIELGPFNVLIGPNDSGKTAFLQALQIACLARPNTETGIGKLEKLPENIEKDKADSWNWNGEKGSEIQFDVYALAMDAENDRRRLFSVIKNKRVNNQEKEDKKDKPINNSHSKDWRTYAIGRIDYLHLDPVALRKPTPPNSTFSSIGEGLPSLVETIRGDIDRFKEFQNEFCSRFPFYKTIHRVFDGNNRVALEFITKNGNTLSSYGISDGVMLSLAYLTLKYTAQLICHRIILIEEPENGVHPGALKEIRDTLWHLSRQRGIQIILTTHSPYLLDLVEPEDVRVFAKDQEGAVYAKNLAEFPDVERMRKHFMTGEIWTEFDENEIVFGKESGTGAKK